MKKARTDPALAELPPPDAPPGAPRGPVRWRWGRRIGWLSFGLLVVALLLWTFCPISSASVETIYSRHVYRWVAHVVIPIADLVPLSLSVTSYVALSVILLAVVLRGWWERKRHAISVLGRILRDARMLAVTAVLAYAVFLVTWGANYRRVPIATQLGLGEGPVQAEEVAELVDIFLMRITADIPPGDARDVEGALAAVRASLAERVAEWTGHPCVLPTRVKQLPAGWMLAFGVRGWTTPPFLEAHTDGADTDVSTVAIGAHELAHVAGFAGEADAELISILAGLRARDPLARYAVALAAFRRCANQLEGDARDAAMDALPAGAQADISAMQKVGQKHWSPSLSRVQSRVYDTYLRSQGVKDGIRDYSRAVTLLALAHRRGILFDADDAASGR